MQFDVLAQEGLSDLIRTYGILIVVGLSVLSGIAKPFIEKLNEKRKDKEIGGAPSMPMAPPRLDRPQHPVARPMPMQRKPGASPASRSRPTARPRPAPTRRVPPPRPAHREIATSLTRKPEPAPKRKPAARRQQPLPSEAKAPSRTEQPKRGTKRLLSSIEPTKVKRSKRADTKVVGMGSPSNLARFTPTSLRRAILLSEILGPPVALRDPDDTL